MSNLETFSPFNTSLDFLFKMKYHPRLTFPRPCMVQATSRCWVSVTSLSHGDEFGGEMGQKRAVAFVCGRCKRVPDGLLVTLHTKSWTSNKESVKSPETFPRFIVIYPNYTGLLINCNCACYTGICTTTKKTYQVSYRFLS